MQILENENISNIDDAKVVQPIAKRKLVLVQINNPALKKFRAMLSEEYPIIDVDSENEALQLVDKQHDNISAILFNVELCKQSGFWLQKKLNEDKRFVGIPNIAVSAVENSDDYIPCIEAGANEYFEPPFRKELIMLRINNTIRGKDSATFSEVEKILKELPSNIYLKDAEGKYVFATHYWHHLHTEGDPNWTIRGKTDIEIREDKENAKKAMESDKELLRTGKGTNYVIKEQGKDGVEYLELIKRPVFDENGNVNGIIALINNVTEIQSLKLELEKRSKTDSLTGLLNKQETESEITDTIKKHCDERGALMMIDVDEFKEVNDKFGHAAGDRVLKEIGDILHKSFKGMYIAGRIGGDEFMVYLRDIKPETAVKLAAMISDKARHLFAGEPLERHVSLSIGLSVFPGHGKNFEDLYRAADMALYFVKEHGRDFYKMYSPELKSLHG
ncbi:diguanylate cyclase (GGDEF) domain-containing protein [Fibrobacter sp. UWT2]|uniref:GGDEF domain-containing response regulator n=1 Tax=Fibrobacter sp. UWT2 TaxID=1896224 RepID=UPI00091F51FC|nr:diguanylate cyclase [Fibrobacter sp. UWT2]SHL47388.1 diguanylate cyclase (GGDEF) domain-containing protein [Fibrobacter sp. UWT2]